MFGGSRWQRILEQKETIRIIFEKHRTFLSLSATILSCGAAWAGYQARVNHQSKLENQLAKITEEIQKEQLQLQNSSAVNVGSSATSTASASTAIVAIQQTNKNDLLKASLSDKRYVRK